MNGDHNIRDHRGGMKKSDFQWADECAGIPRVILKHVSDLARAETPFLVPELRALVSAVKLDDPAVVVPASVEVPAVVAPASVEPAVVVPASRRVLRQHPSACSSIGSDAVICGVNCQCPACRKVELVASDEDSSAAADAVVTVPPPRLAARVREHLDHLEHANDTDDGEEEAILEFAKPPQNRVSKRVNKRPASASGLKAHQHPTFKIVRRANPFREHYCLMNGRYLVTCSERTSENFADIMEQVVKELTNGDLEPKNAKLRVLSLAGKA